MCGVHYTVDWRKVMYISLVGLIPIDLASLMTPYCITGISYSVATECFTHGSKTTDADLEV